MTRCLIHAVLWGTTPGMPSPYSPVSRKGLGQPMRQGEGNEAGLTAPLQAVILKAPSPMMDTSPRDLLGAPLAWDGIYGLHTLPSPPAFGVTRSEIDARLPPFKWGIDS